MLLDEPDIIYTIGNFLYSRSFVQAARECDEWDEQAFRILLDMDTNSIIELADGSALVSGKESVTDFENCVGNLVRERAEEVAIETGPLCTSLCMGGTPLRDFQWIRSTPSTFLHMWSPNFALLPTTINFKIRDNVPPPFERCKITLRTLRNRRFSHVQDFKTFLGSRLLNESEHATAMGARIESFSLSGDKRDVSIVLNTLNIGERNFFAMLCVIIDFGFLHVPIKEILFT